jgi:hypothetical protein
VRTYRTSRGPFLEAPFFSDAEIQSICLDELTKYNLLPDTPAAIRIERFVEKRFKVTVEPADLGEGMLGLTKFGSNGVRGMFVSEALESDKSVSAARRVRTTIAHEAGHGLLHAHLFVTPTTSPLFGDVSDVNSPKVLCREEAIEGNRKHYGGEWWEFQANAAMGHLLMPRPLLEKAVEQFLVAVGNLGGRRIDPARYESAIRVSAETFEVNPIVARIQIEGLYSTKGDRQLSL